MTGASYSVVAQKKVEMVGFCVSSYAKLGRPIYFVSRSLQQSSLQLYLEQN